MFKQNDLVRLIRSPIKGIGCIARVYKKYYKVNFGTREVKACYNSQLELVDTSQCKTMTVQEFQTALMAQKIDYLIVGNELKQNTGISMVSIRVVTEEDLKKYPRLIE